MISKAQQVFYVNTIPTAAIGKEKDIAVHSNGNMYVKKGGRWIVLNISSSEVFGEDKLISGYIELSAPVSTISATLEYITEMITTITTTVACEILVNVTFEAETQSGASGTVLAVAIEIDGTVYDEYQRYLSGANDIGIGAITHRSGEVAIGDHNVRILIRRVSGVATPGLNHCDMTVLALQGAKGAQGESSMRGNAVFVSATEPTNKQVNDIWIVI